MNEVRHNALKIKEAAQAAVHKKIVTLDHEGLVRYFASRESTYSKVAPTQNKPLLVCEPVSEYPKTEG